MIRAATPLASPLFNEVKGVECWLSLVFLALGELFPAVSAELLVPRVLGTAVGAF